MIPSPPPPLLIAPHLTLSAFLACLALSLFHSAEKSERDLNQAGETLSHKQPSAFFHSHPDLSIWLKRDIWGWDVGGGRKHEAMRRSENGEVCREKGGPRSECLPPSARWITDKKGSTSNGLRRSRRRRRAEMEEMIAEARLYWGDAGFSLAGMEGRWERLRLSVCLPLIEVGKRASGCCSAPK